MAVETGGEGGVGESVREEERKFCALTHGFYLLLLP